jgi:hypothetical protein
LGLHAVVVIVGRHNEADLIACKRAFRDGKIELVSEHFAGDGAGSYFEAEREILDFAVPSRLLPYPDSIEVRSGDREREEQEANDRSRDSAAH